jgi:hypothetical protein
MFQDLENNWYRMGLNPVFLLLIFCYSGATFSSGPIMPRITECLAARQEVIPEAEPPRKPPCSGTCLGACIGPRCAGSRRIMNRAHSTVVMYFWYFHIGDH